jgi:hypothetical protein
VNGKEQELIVLGIALMLLGSVLGMFAVYMPTFVMAKMKTKSGDIPDESDSNPIQGNEQGPFRRILDDKVHVPEQGWIKGKWTGGQVAAMKCLRKALMVMARSHLAAHMAAASL